MIYVIIGTMGEYTKMLPVMRLFDQYKIDYRFVHTGQHYQIIESNRKRLKNRKPDFYLTFKRKDLANFWEFLKWAPQVLFNARKLPVRKDDFVIVHGDAESTLLGLLIGKFFRAKIIHIEAGLRTGNFLEPFPEEIVRTVTDHFADICFCPYKENAKNIKCQKDVYITDGNTVFDAIADVLQIKPSSKVRLLQKKRYILFAVHRKENLMIKKRLIAILNILELILKQGSIVIWPIHENAQYELRTKGLWLKIGEFKKKYQLKTDCFFNYVDFMHAVNHSQYVAADSGGLQMETYYLNKPMLILRQTTEIQEGNKETAYLSRLQQKRVQYFLKNYKKFKRRTKIQGSPSKVIVNFLKSKIKEN